MDMIVFMGDRPIQYNRQPKRTLIRNNIATIVSKGGCFKKGLLSCPSIITFREIRYIPKSFS